MNARFFLLAGLWWLSGCGVGADEDLSLEVPATVDSELSAPAIAPGRTPTAFSVSNTGGATYTLPLWASPGVGQIEPKLELRYDSQLGDGPFGVGWSLTGLSMISRCPSTLMSNGLTKPVTLSSGDRFCLDGRQLKLKTGTHGAASSTYGTELDSFSHIEAVGQSGAGPASFTVKTKDGLIHRYGHSGEAMTISNTVPAGTLGSTFYVWMLREVEDRSGNLMTFTWKTDAEETPRLLSVKYPKTATGQGPFSKVTLAYESRTDTMEGWHLGGKRLTQLTRVSSVTVSAADDTIIKQYRLSYSNGLGSRRSTLTTVQECALNVDQWTCLAPTTIRYSAGSIGFKTTTSGSGTAGTLGCGPVTGDFNGDGKTDLAWAPYSASTLDCTWRVRFSTGTGYSADVLMDAKTVLRHGQVVVGQFLRKSSTQLLLPIPNASGASPVFHVVEYDAVSNTFVKTSTGVAAGMNIGTDAYLQAGGDYDGDGLTDLFFELNPGAGTSGFRGGQVLVRLNQTGADGVPKFSEAQRVLSTPSVVGEVSGATQYGHKYTQGAVQAADFNGDGLQDVLALTRRFEAGSTGAWTYFEILVSLSKGAPDGVVPHTPGTPPTVHRYDSHLVSIYDVQPPPVTLLDWNGDGSMDFQVGLTVFLSRANAAFTQVTLPSTVVLHKDTAPLGVDYNGDGRTDLIYRDANELKYVLSTGVGGSAPASLGISLPSGPARVFSQDMNGDGWLELAVVRNASSVALPAVYGRAAVSGEGGSMPDLAYELKDGYGLTHRVSYGSIANDATYDRVFDATFPERGYIGPLYVVTRVITGLGGASDSGARELYRQDFSYQRAFVNVWGPGFLGFETKVSADSRGRTIVESFKTSFPFMGVSQGRQVLTTAGARLSSLSGTPKSMVTNSTGEEARFFTYLSPVELKTYEPGKDHALVTKEEVETTYDLSGNPTSTVTTVSDVDSSTPGSPLNGSEWVQTVTRTFAASTVSQWCLGMPLRVMLRSEAPGQTTLTRTTTFESDLAKCRIKKELDEPSTPYETARELGFDSCGNLTSVKVTGRAPDGAALAPRTTSMSFGTRCQLPEATTNALDAGTSVKYDYRFGTPTEQVDQNGLKTTFVVDPYGRLSQVTAPDGTTVSFNLSSCNGFSNCLSDVVRRAQVKETLVDKDGTAVASQWRTYDAFDELVLQTSQHVLSSSETVDVQVTYDALGRPTRVLRPYREGDSSVGYSLYQYDLLNRPLSERVYAVDGTLERATSRTYLGLTTLETDARGHVTTRVRDALGLLRQVTEPSPGGTLAGATTTFEYNAHGNLNKTTDALGNVSTRTPNLMGFITSSTDANRGTTTHSVNSLGELVGWSDAKGQSTSVIYDALGRRTSLTAPEGTTRWTWGTSATAKNIGRLASMTGGGATEAFTYDSIGRPSVRTITLDGVSYQFNYSYNSLGLLDVLTYPTSPQPSSARLAVKYEYSRGRLFRLSDATTSTAATLWELKSENAAGAITSARIGRATPATTQHVYSPTTGELTGLLAGVGTSTSNRQNLGYAWDAAGNLKYRQDAAHSLLEEFVSDPMNRLSSSKLNGSTNLTVSYDAAGNIQNRSDVGTYTYGDASHPSAVTRAGSVDYTYDANGNVSTKAGFTQTWASFDLPTVLRNGSNTTAFSYGPTRGRYKQVATYAGLGTETTTFVGGLLEVVQPTSGPVQWRHLVPTPEGNTVAVTRSSAGTKTYVLLTDHLGSTDTVLDGDTGAIVVAQSFSPFGARRGTSWSGAPASSALTSIAATSRDGFTGHSQLDNLGLVHMGGRVYDATIGRFMSVDPVFIRGLPQQNAYSYVRNQPLSRIDPTGLSDSTASTLPATPGSGQDPGCGCSVSYSETGMTFTVYGMAPPTPPPAPPSGSLGSSSGAPSAALRDAWQSSINGSGSNLAADLSGPRPRGPSMGPPTRSNLVAGELSPGMKTYNKFFDAMEGMAGLLNARGRFGLRLGAPPRGAPIANAKNIQRAIDELAGYGVTKRTISIKDVQTQIDEIHDAMQFGYRPKVMVTVVDSKMNSVRANTLVGAEADKAVAMQIMGLPWSRAFTPMSNPAHDAFTNAVYAAKLAPAEFMSIRP